MIKSDLRGSMATSCLECLSVLLEYWGGDYPIDVSNDDLKVRSAPIPAICFSNDGDIQQALTVCLCETGEACINLESLSQSNDEDSPSMLMALVADVLITLFSRDSKPLDEVISVFKSFISDSYFPLDI